MSTRRWKRALVITLMSLDAIAIIVLVLSLMFNGPQALRLVLPIVVGSVSVGLLYWKPEIQELFRPTD